MKLTSQVYTHAHVHVYKCIAHGHIHVSTVYHSSPRRFCRDGLVDFLFVELVLVD